MLPRAVRTLAFLALLLRSQPVDPTELRVSYAAYHPLSAPSFVAGTSVVEVGAVVRDAHGESVRGPTRGDFRIFDGAPREIASFHVVDSSRSETAPRGLPVQPARRILLLFDDFLADDIPRLKDAQVPGLLALKRAAERFVTTNLRLGDSVSVATTARGTILPFTSDIASMLAAIRTVNSNPRPSLFLDTAVLAAIESTVAEVARLPGIRTIVLLSSGLSSEMSGRDLTDAHAHEQSIVARALAANILIHAIDGKGLYTKLPSEAVGDPVDLASLPPRLRARMGGLPVFAQPIELSNYPLESMAYGSGGSFFHNDNDLLKGLRQLIEPDVHYLLTFTSEAQADGRYHPLRVKLLTPGHYSIEARPGYFAPTEDDARAISTARFLDAKVLADEAMDALPVTFSARPSLTASGLPNATSFCD